MFIAVTHGNGGHHSGVKQTREAVETWAKNQLESTKHTRILIFEAIADMHVAPRVIETTELKPPPKADVQCEECAPAPAVKLFDRVFGNEEYHVD